VQLNSWLSGPAGQINRNHAIDISSSVFHEDIQDSTQKSKYKILISSDRDFKEFNGDMMDMCLFKLSRYRNKFIAGV
jgi:hypothetical protein